MPDILVPLPFEDLPTKPPLTGRVRITEEMQQSLALLSGWDGASRQLLRLSPTGILFVASPRVKDIVNILADQASYNWQGSNIKTTDILIRANPDNSDRVWVNVDEAAAPNTGYPLNSGEWVNLTVTNLINLHIHIVADTEKAIIIYTV